MTRKLLEVTRTACLDEVICDYCGCQIGIINRSKGEEVPDPWNARNFGEHNCSRCRENNSEAYDNYVDPLGLR